MRQSSSETNDRPAGKRLRLDPRVLAFATLARRTEAARRDAPTSNRGAIVGASVGAAMSSLLAVLASLRVLRSPWLEPFVTIGPFFAALNGAAIGATFGAFFGALVGIAAKDDSERRTGDRGGAKSAGRPVSSSSTALRVHRIFARHTRATRLHDSRAARSSARAVRASA